MAVSPQGMQAYHGDPLRTSWVIKKPGSHHMWALPGFAGQQTVPKKIFLVKNWAAGRH
jgi:hypothetical protein